MPDQPDFEHIWLTPRCEHGCPQVAEKADAGPCPGCGRMSVYLRADLASENHPRGRSVAAPPIGRVPS